MLVCNVSLLRRRAAIAADLAEAAAAMDAPGTGNVVFATLVDDPASVGDRVDAYLGEIMREAASAASTVTVSVVYTAAVIEAAAAAHTSSTSGPSNYSAAVVEPAAAVDFLSVLAPIDAAVVEPATAGDSLSAFVFVGAAVVETATAADTQDATYTVTMAETSTAADTPDATLIGGVTYVTWDAATVTAVTLSGGDLIATNTGTTATNQGAHVASTSGKTIGKFYFESKRTALPSGGNQGVGIGTTASTYTGMGNNATTGNAAFVGTGNIYANGSASGTSIGSISNGNTVGVAVDLDNRKIWFRQGVASFGNWNNSGTANPATNTGGITIPVGTMVPFATFGGSGGTAGGQWTANFGGSTFFGTVPSGFTPGWTA